MCEPVLTTREAAAEHLAGRLRALGIPPRMAYATGDVAAILGISRETVRGMILRWEPPGTPGRPPAGLFARQLNSHRRVPHEALVDWLARNSAYAREIAAA